MPRLAQKTPVLPPPQANGQAVVRLDGRDVYLGRYGSPESRAEYDRLIADWLAAGRPPPRRRGRRRRPTSRSTS